MLIGEQCLKEGDTYFKKGGIIHIFQNFVIFFLKITKNNYHCYIVLFIPELLVTFIFL